MACAYCSTDLGTVGERMQMVMERKTSGSWFYVPRPVAEPRLRLLCFPYAGAGAAVYRSWPGDLPESIELWAVELPGHDSRTQERPFKRLDALLPALESQIEPLLDEPFALFGHSLGALIAFELARRLQQRRLPAPRHVFVSGLRRPEELAGAPRLHDLPLRDLVRALDRMGGTPAAVLEEPGLMAHFAPMLRADLALVETHVWRDEPRLEAPVTAFAGDRDPRAGRTSMEGWRDHTRGRFQLRELPGDHFFVSTQQRRLTATVVEQLEVPALQ